MRNFKVQTWVDVEHSFGYLKTQYHIEAPNLVQALLEYQEKSNCPEKIDFRIAVSFEESCVEAFNIDRPDVVLDWIFET